MFRRALQVVWIHLTSGNHDFPSRVSPLKPLAHSPDTTGGFDFTQAYQFISPTRSGCLARAALRSHLLEILQAHEGLRVTSPRSNGKAKEEARLEAWGVIPSLPIGLEYVWTYMIFKYNIVTYLYPWARLRLTHPWIWNSYIYPEAGGLGFRRYSSKKDLGLLFWYWIRLDVGWNKAETKACGIGRWCSLMFFTYSVSRATVFLAWKMTSWDGCGHAKIQKRQSGSHYLSRAHFSCCPCSF